MRFDLLGPLRVTHEDRTLEIGGAKQQLVLGALLLARGTVVSTDRLLDLVWGDNPPNKPHVTLRSYISHLRRVVEPQREAGARPTLLITRAPGYALEVDRSQIDLVRFEDSVGEARALLIDGDPHGAFQTLTNGLALWRGPQLGDGLFDPSDPEVIRSSELRAGAQVFQLELLLHLGRHEEALPPLEAMLAGDPTREGPRRLHMLALYRAGRKRDALASFQAARTATIDELGLEPGADLRNLEVSILNDDEDLRWQAPVSTATSAPIHAEAPAELPPAPIGRLAEAQVLVELLTSTLHGTSSVAAITGEPGIGKSTLLQNTLHRAEGLGFRTIVGRCHDGVTSSPLMPWVPVLEALTSGVEASVLEELVNDSRSVIAKVIPTLAATVEALDQGAGEQQALFTGVARLLRQATAAAPIALAFEDLHWADPITVRLLNFLATELEDTALVLVVTWRDTEVISDELAAGLADLGQAARHGRIALKGVGVEETAELHRKLFGQELSPAQTGSIVGQTAGNPLFIVELLRSLANDGRLEPSDTIRDVLRRRIRQLPDGAERSLTIGALCPDGFTEHLVGAVNGNGAEQALDLLEAALAAGLIEEDPYSPEKFRFSHAVIADTLTSSLSGPRRARFHAAIGNELEATGAPVDVLAHHFLRGATAGSGLNGAEYAHRAAVEAIDLWDYTQAADLLEAGLAALDLCGEDDDALRADLLIDLMQVRKHQERAQDAQATGEKAFAVAKAAGDSERMAIASLVYCGWPRPTEGRQRDQWLGYWSPPGPSIAMLTSCVDKVPTDHWLRPAVLIALAAQHFGEHEDLAYCAQLFDEAHTLTREQEEPDLESAVLMAAFHKFQRTSTMERRRRTLDELLQLCQRHGLTDRDVATRRARAVLALDMLDHEGAVEETRALRQTAAATRDPLLAMYAAASSISLLLLRGDHAEAETQIMAALDEFAELGSASLDQLGLQYSLLTRERGQLDDVEAMLRWKLEGYPGPAFAGPLASILTLLGRDEEASELISSFSRVALTLGGEGVLQFTTPCFFAEAIADLGDVERASWLYDALQGAEGRIVAMFDGVSTYGCGSYYLGRLATALGLLTEAERHFAIADHFHLAVGARPYHLRTILARAELDRASGRSAEPRMAEAQTLAENLGMTWLVEIARSRARLNNFSTPH